MRAPSTPTGKQVAAAAVRLVVLLLACFVAIFWIIGLALDVVVGDFSVRELVRCVLFVVVVCAFAEDQQHT